MTNQDLWNDLLQKDKNPQHRAPYNFITPPEKVASTPWAEGEAAALNGGNPTHAKPLKNSINGVLNVSWAFEQDFLIGGEGETKNQQVKYRGEPVLPGSSIRGMLRNVLEITTASRVEHMDREAQFAFRTWSSGNNLAKIWIDTLMPNGPNGKPHIAAGLLIPPKQNTHDDPYEGWQFIPGEIARLHEDDGFKCLGKVRPVDWDDMSPNARYQYFADAICEDKTCTVGQRQIPQFGLKWNQAIPERCSHSAYPIKEPSKTANGRIGLIGFAEEIRINNQPTINDSWIFVYDLQVQQSVILPAKVVKKFVLTHNAVPKAENALKFWLDRYEANDKCEIPVTYVAPIGLDKDQALKNGNISLGLTRAMKLPHKYNVGQVADNSGAAYKRNNATHLDFTQALFGHVPGKDVAGNTPEYRANKPETHSWQSRIFFRHAELQEGQSLTQYTLTNVIANSPKASFAPNYLRSDDLQSEHHWSDNRVKLAGRKRYPVRKKTAAFPGDPKCTEGIDALGVEAKGVNSNVAFSRASSDMPIVFNGPIRLHNLHPIEFGALLWVLGYGEPVWEKDAETTYRHAMGRGKPQGYGRVKAVIDSAELKKPDGTSVTQNDFADYVAMFEKWMALQNVENINQEGVSLDFKNLTHIQELWAMADPEIGDAADKVLQYISKGGGETASIDGHMDIKKKNETRKKGTPLHMLPKYPRQRKP